jgi:GAF domain-containing protein
LLINRDIGRRPAARFGAGVSCRALPKSQLVVPMLAGDQVVGMLDLNHLTREKAFSESDVRLLETIAASMSVALENARLFDETQRLLKEKEQRSSELAVINSIQQGMAAEMNFQAIVDLVGDKLREVFASQDLIIGLLDADGRTARFVYVVEHGVRLAEQTFEPLGPGPGIARCASGAPAGRATPPTMRPSRWCDARTDAPTSGSTYR